MIPLSEVVLCEPALNLFLPFVHYVFAEADKLTMKYATLKQWRNALSVLHLDCYHKIFDRLLFSQYTSLPELVFHFQEALFKAATLDPLASHYELLLKINLSDRGLEQKNPWKIPFVLSYVSKNPLLKFHPSHWQEYIMKEPRPCDTYDDRSDSEEFYYQSPTAQ
jgi:hypothetical protein